MKLYAPAYYGEFKCIADKCKHSCCAGWEIDIDKDTLERYKAREGGYFDSIIGSIDFEGDAHFRLMKGEKCPHLDSSGLCRIITELGEGWLCDICREHPRFYNDTPRGTEVGVGMSCEAACRLILESEDYRDIALIGEVDGQISNFEFDTAAERDKIYSILSDKGLPYPQRLVELWRGYDVSPKILSDEAWREILGYLEYLNEENRELFSLYSSSEESLGEQDSVLEKFLAYMIFRHTTPKATKEGFRAALGFSFFAERLLASVLKAGKIIDKAEVFEVARTISEEIEYSEENTATITMEFEFG
ncbi:MAG: hypothetical protein E7612_04105 [Ruminococcaceae bacterium]|nr:hypothetical protein [Oscillospiraceae bacterium]